MPENKTKADLEKAINILVEQRDLLSAPMIWKIVSGLPVKTHLAFLAFLSAVAATPFSISKLQGFNKTKDYHKESISDFRDTLDNIFSEEWFVYPDFNSTTIGVRRLPPLIKVTKPIVKIEACDTIFVQGDIISIDCGGNVILEHSWSPKDVPERQKTKLFEWNVLHTNRESNIISLEKINNLLGDSGWTPHPNPEYSSFSIKGFLKKILNVNFPITNVDDENGHKFAVGDKVPPDQKITIWFSGNIESKKIEKISATKP